MAGSIESRLERLEARLIKPKQRVWLRRLVTKEGAPEESDEDCIARHGMDPSAKVEYCFAIRVVVSHTRRELDAEARRILELEREILALEAEVGDDVH